MDKKLIEKYKNEMINLYLSSNSAKQNKKETAEAIPVLANPSAPTSDENTAADTKGELIGIVTSLNEIYPVNGAKVTVFTGNYENMKVIDTDLTDSSGRTKNFVLSAPEKELSESAGQSPKPYSSYNMLVQADGYVDNIHLNIPIFSGVISLQGSDMMLSETAGENKGSQIFDESQEYTL